MAQDEYSKIFLFNKLVKLQSRLDAIEKSITTTNMEIGGLRNLHQVYSKDPKMGDADEVQEV